jgi:hypothetical protein
MSYWMTRERSRYGLIASTLGAGLLAASVFLPWYGVSSPHRAAAGIGGAQIRMLTAHQALTGLSVVLLVLAWLALLDALLALASASSGAGASVVVFGALASAIVAYRMVHPAVAGGGAVSVSLQSGAWVALLGSIMMTLGSLWPRARGPEPRLSAVWPGLSGAA